jgi:hypothetical protein
MSSAIRGVRISGLPRVLNRVHLHLVLNCVVKNVGITSLSLV